MPTADELLKKYNVSLERELPIDADSILAKYGVSVEEPSPFKAEFAPAEPVTTFIKERPIEEYKEPTDSITRQQLQAEMRGIAERERERIPEWTAPTIIAGKPIEEKEYQRLEKTFLSRVGRAQGVLLLKGYREHLEKYPEEIGGAAPESFLDSFIKNSPMGLFPRLLGIEPRFARVETEALRKKHPVASRIGKAGGDLMTLVATSQIGGAVTKGIALAGRPYEMVFKNGKLMMRLLSYGAGRGVMWGLKGFLGEAAQQRDKEEYSVKNLLKETSYEGAYGLIWGTSLAIPKAYLRITSAGAGRMAYDTARTLIEKHKITKENLLSISLNGAMSAILASVGARTAEQQWKVRTDWTYGIEASKDPLLQKYIGKIQEGAIPEKSFWGAIKRGIIDIKNIKAMRKLFPLGYRGTIEYDLEGNAYILPGKSHLEMVAGKQMLVPNVYKIPAPQELKSFLRIVRPIAVVEIAKNLPPNLAEATPEMQTHWVRSLIKGWHNTGSTTEAVSFANKSFQEILPMLKFELPKEVTPPIEKPTMKPEPIREETERLEREFPLMTEDARKEAERRARLAAEEPLPPVEKVKEIPEKKVIPKEPVMAEIEELYTKAMEATKEKGEKLRLQKELSFIGGKITTPTEMRRLRRLTHAWQFRKGMTKKAFGEVVHKITGHWKTTHKDITAEQLKKIISIVKEHRPKRIGYRTVVTEKTEGQIGTLKENLIKTKSLTEDIFNKILEKENIRYPGWIHKANFITEETGKKLIKRMVDESPIYKDEIGTETAMGRHPQVKKVYNTGRNFIEKKAERVQASPKRAIINTMKDWRFVAMDMQEQTNDPFYETYYRLNYKRRGLEVDNDKINDRWVQAGGKDFNNIAVDEERKMKINDWLASFLEEPGAPKRPMDMTDSELAMAKEIQKILEEFKPKVRYLRFFEWRNFGTRIPDATDKQLNEALDILNIEGYEALEKHLEKQSWGVIKSGYDIREVYRPKIRIKKVRPAPRRGHLRTREGMEYLKSDRDILQRVQSYVKQINTRYYLMEEINSMRSLFENNYDKFKDPRRIADAFDRLFREALHQRNVSSALMNWVTKPYAQAMRAIFLDPYKYVRNLMQNISFYASPQDFINILKKSPLSEVDRDYYFRQGSQMTGLKHDYFMQYVGLPGFGKINKIVDKVNLYPKTDDINRVCCYIFKLGRIRKAMKKYPDNFDKMIVSAGFGDLELLQRLESMEKYVTDKEDMARYLAVEETKNVHFVYERAMRAPAEQGGDFERVMSNLLTFRKGYIQRLWNNINKLRPSRIGVEAPYGARRRAFRVMTQMILVSTLAGWVFKRVVGRKRNPYSPLAIVDDVSLGGIPLGAQEQIGQLTHDVADALQGNTGALGRVIVAIPRAGDMYIPFYRNLVDIMESVFGYKNLDYAALRQIRSALDKRYKAKGMNYYKVERNAVQMFRHALFASRETAKKNESTLKQALRRRLK